jgi:hypothetical protein
VLHADCGLVTFHSCCGWSAPGQVHVHHSRTRACASYSLSGSFGNCIRVHELSWDWYGELPVVLAGVSGAASAGEAGRPLSRDVRAPIRARSRTVLLAETKWVTDSSSCERTCILGNKELEASQIPFEGDWGVTTVMADK